jgi:uncharacterized MAPEG superfamily protein
MGPATGRTKEVVVDMTVPFWCLLIVIFIPYVISTLTGYFKTRQLGTLDNKNPRVQAGELTGVGARAVAAQQNAWEAVAVFTVAVVVNHLRGDADPGTAAMLAAGFVVCRILHAIFYLSNFDIGRSLVFLVSSGLAIAMFFA